MPLVRAGDRLRAAVAGLTGWRRLALALALGAGATLALPPHHVVPVLPLAFAGLLWLIDGCRGPGRAAVVGWAFGVGFFAAGLSWIGSAFLVDAERFGAFAVPAVAGLAMGLALFTALAAALTRLAAPGVARVLALALAWVAMEWLRGHLLTGFPWNLLATVWAPWDPMMQGASLIGVYGLSLLTALIAILPATLRRAPVLAAAVLLALTWAGGTVRLAGVEDTTVPGVRLRLVQAGIEQRDKWRPELRIAHLARHLELSRTPVPAAPSHIIWPEAAIAFFLEEQPDVRAAIAEVVPPGGVVITGVARRSYDAADAMRVWNSIQAIDDAGAVVATYDKVHLVPFGEYMPLRGWIPFDKLTKGTLDFSAGGERRTLVLPGLPPAAPLVCYEVIFPGDVVPPGPRPGWLLNVTNDSWFGRGGGPYQHLAAARFRSVEEGLPLVRVAGGGISAVVDAFGRVRARLDLGAVGILDADLPAPLAAPPPYARWGDGPVALVAFGMLAVIARRSRAGVV